jgi:hypothetical protein
VVCPVSPPPTALSSSTTTPRPALASRYAVVIPAMPAPTTHTSAVASPLSASYCFSGDVTFHTDLDLSDASMPHLPLGCRTRAGGALRRRPGPRVSASRVRDLSLAGAPNDEGRAPEGAAPP